MKYADLYVKPIRMFEISQDDLIKAVNLLNENLMFFGHVSMEYYKNVLRNIGIDFPEEYGDNKRGFVKHDNNLFEICHSYSDILKESVSYVHIDYGCIS